MITKSKYYYGNEISKYGLENGYVDYGTLASCFNHVLNNDILSELEKNGYYFDLINAPDFSDEIEDAEGQIDYLQEKIDDLRDKQGDASGQAYNDIENEIENLENDIYDLQNDIDYYQCADRDVEFFQYYIIDNSGARILTEDTTERVFYNEDLDMYIWGVTHCGTAWDYVLTDIEIR